MPPNILSVARLIVILVSLGLVAYLLWRGELPAQVRVVVIAALAYYAVRLWVVASRARRRRGAHDREDRQGRGTDGHSNDGA